MRIIRHPIAIIDYQEIYLPGEGEVLSVAASREFPNHGIDLWALDYERGEQRTVTIYVIGTGNPMPTDLAAEMDPHGHGGIPVLLPDHKFIGTVVTANGLVWHIFEGPVR